jgi:uncharacterized protein (TIGR00251 family)
MAGPSTRLRLRVSPGARTKSIDRHGDGWKVRVAAVPERGKANEAVIEFLAQRLELPEESIELVSGHSSRDKIVELTGIERAEAERRLEQAK